MGINNKWMVCSESHWKEVFNSYNDAILRQNELVEAGDYSALIL